MPPHLHPRSRSTTSLFTATLLASLFIVGLPHVFPCPAPRKAFADSELITTPDGQLQRVRRRRRRSKDQADELSTSSTPATAAAPAPTEPDSATRQLAEEAAEFRYMQEEAKRISKMSRECPVPKPRGILGDILGFDRDQSVAKRRDSRSPSDVSGREGE
jgi:cytochrome c oxidase assembly factor 2